MQLLKIKALTPEAIQFLVRRPKFTRTEYNHIFLLLATHNINNTMHLLIQKLLDSPHPAVYCFEVKHYLKQNDETLYYNYANKFIRNAGSDEAFGVGSENRTAYVRVEEKDVVQMLDPVFTMRKKKSRDSAKKVIRREARIVADGKISALIKEGKEYKTKVKRMYAKISSNK